MGGQPKSDACGDLSRAVRRSAQEPTEAIPQNRRDAARILFTLGRGGCQDCNLTPASTLRQHAPGTARLRNFRSSAGGLWGFATGAATLPACSKKQKKGKS